MTDDKIKSRSQNSPILLTEMDNAQISLCSKIISDLFNQLKINTNNGVLAMLETTVAALAVQIKMKRMTKEQYTLCIDTYIKYMKEISKEYEKLMDTISDSDFNKASNNPLDVVIIHSEDLENIFPPKTPTKH